MIWAKNFKRGFNAGGKGGVCDQGFRLTMAKNIGNRIRVEAGVDRVHDPAAGRHPVMAFHHFRGVKRHNRNRIPFANANRVQARCQLPATAKDLCPSVTALAMDHTNTVRENIGGAGNKG